MMKLDSPASRIGLAARETVRLSQGKGETVVCRTGTIWITIDHDRRDIILGPGQCFEIDSDEAVLLHAFEVSTVGIVGRRRRATAPATRLREWLVATFGRAPANRGGLVTAGSS
jgi:hypothetical protein